MRVEGFKSALLSALVIASLIVPAILFIPASQASAQLADTPWPKFRHDGQNTGRSPYVGAQDNALKWSYAIGGGGGWMGAPSPAVGADGTIYMGSDDNRLYALNPDGMLKWFYQTDGVIRSSPAIGANGTIYVTSGEVYGRLYALDENGTLKWTFENVFGYSSPAIGSDGTIYVGSYNSYVASLSALHENGDLKWSFSTGLHYGLYFIISCPAIGPDGTIYFTVLDYLESVGYWPLGYGPLGWLFALDENGALKWSRWAGGTSPAVGTDGTIYLSSGNKFIALNPDNTLKWAYPMLRASSSPAIGTDNTIFMGGGDTLYALNQDNTLKWSYATGGIIGSSPAVGAGTIYVGSGDNKLYAFSENGTLMWTYVTGGEVYSSPAIGAGGITYVGSNDGELYAIGQRAKFSLVTLYEIGLDVHLWLENGSKLVVKFYSYMGDNQGENLVWENMTPAHVVLLENIPHSMGEAVEKAELVLTDEVGATISTLSTFIVWKVDLEARFMEIPFYWSIAPPGSQERLDLETEFMEIPFYWSGAPS
ncbi:MAG: PQQ-binding-like beta-propeller repeat protein [Candidatus Hadarchaeaceae archaeon]